MGSEQSWLLRFEKTDTLGSIGGSERGAVNHRQSPRNTHWSYRNIPHQSIHFQWWKSDFGVYFPLTKYILSHLWHGGLGWPASPSLFCKRVSPSALSGRFEAMSDDNFSQSDKCKCHQQSTHNTALFKQLKLWMAAIGPTRGQACWESVPPGEGPDAYDRANTAWARTFVWLPGKSQHIFCQHWCYGCIKKHLPELTPKRGNALSLQRCS